ncbi:MAG: mechanosensitive ion channel, partial [Deltaproteobacteria bacterium]|nr:mechanosensitive ion channel [Deltaproteobacteria bacterium]
PRGVPYAISTSAFYVMLMVGFFAAVAAAGMDLSRFAILAGALGVGIGFGLQNVVNNFVSGLILLFERPIKTGDTIEVGLLLGEVKRIGIRASTVRTWQGAEVIVPNGDLISGQVTNWTLSDHNRRIDVDVGVKYGTDPERVLQLLLDVAAAEDRILEMPAPSALFRGFGDSSLDFRLRAWTSRSEEWVRIHSDLNVAVNRALAEAGIEIPFPQRDLHLRSVAPELRRPLAEDEAARPPVGFAGSQPLPHADAGDSD